MKKIVFGFIFVLIQLQTSAGDDFCATSNFTFTSGEQVTFKVFYNVIGIYVDAGTAVFSVSKEKMGTKDVFHVVGIGKSNPSYDWIFKVRDRYETFLDTMSLKPLKFVRAVDEGGYLTNENVTFNHEAGTATSTNGVFKVPTCVQDVMSAIYFARNINYNKLKIDDRIPFSMFIDDQVNNLFIRYAGKEEIKTRFGRYNAIKIKPLLLKGNVFDGGEKMTIWVSDDSNHIPLRIETPIAVGSIKVDMMGYSNIKYPLTSQFNGKNQDR
jgi:hypothetical protein